MAQIDAGRIIAKCLKAEGVEFLHSVPGGHNNPIIRGCMAEGIQVIGHRDERGATHAADGYARTTGKPGVICVTAGCGVTNAATALATANIDNVPIVLLAGRHQTVDDLKMALQELEGEKVCQPITKFAKCVYDWGQIPYFMGMAFRQATAPTPGPAFLEFPADILLRQGEENEVKYTPPERYRTTRRPQGDPADIEQAVELLLEAERPIIAAGDGVFWSCASAELRELAELTQIPTYTTKLGEGALPEQHPLSLHRVVRSKLTRYTDVALAVGVRFWRGEGYGSEPVIWNPGYRLIQVDGSQTRIGHNTSPEIGIVGDPKAVLRQMIECARERIGRPRKHGPWLEKLETETRIFRVAREREVKEHWDSKPVHPARLSYEIANFLDEDASIVYDGNRSIYFFEKWVEACFAGQVLPLSQFGGMGTGVGWAIGAQLARPGKQVLLMEGDGAFGIAGMEIETASRYNLPIVVVLHNNSGWFPGARRMLEGDGGMEADMRAFEFQMGLRYDKMAEGLGCHGEHVEDPDEIRPALERAFASGKTALINVVMEKLSAGGATRRVRFW